MYALIVDDEQLARTTLEGLLKEFCPTITTIKMATGVLEAVKIIQQKSPDIVFLDIEMPKISGLRLPSYFDEHPLPFQIIFTTAYSKYAVEAFRLSAVDYLLKPISIDQLQEAVAKIKTQKKSNVQKGVIALQENLQAKTIKRLVVPTSEGLEFIMVDELRLLIADGSYTSLQLKSGKKIMVSKNLKEFQKLEEYSHFFKPHRSYLINTHNIRKLSNVDGQHIVLDDGTQVPLSKRKKAAFMEMLNDFNL